MLLSRYEIWHGGFHYKLTTAINVVFTLFSRLYATEQNITFKRRLKDAAREKD